MNVFFFCFWNKEYLENFLELSLPSIAHSLQNINLKDLSTSKIEIWTTKENIKLIKKNITYINIKNKINFNYELIDQIIKKNTTEHKYELVTLFQNIAYNCHYFKYKYVWFFYPDQYFSDDLIQNSLKILKKDNLDMILMPSIETKNLETKKNLLNSRKNKDIKKIKLKYLHSFYKHNKKKK